MENFSWWNYLLALAGSCGGVWGLFKAGAWVMERIGERKKVKVEETKREIEQEIAEAVELRKAEIHIEHLDREAARQVLLQIVTERNNEIGALKAEIVDLRHLKSLTDGVIRLISRRIDKLSRKIGVIEDISGRIGHEELRARVRELREGVEDLESALA